MPASRPHSPSTSARRAWRDGRSSASGRRKAVPSCVSPTRAIRTATPCARTATSTRRRAPSTWGATWFIPVLHDYWRHTGDDGAAREFLPNVRRLLGYFRRFTREDGLFEQRLETSKHAFAPSLQKGDTRHRSYMDVLLWMCWRGAAEMARAVGADADAAAWEK